MTSINSNKPEILSKLGVGSGLDTTALVDSLVQAETAGTRESLEIAEEKYNTQISAFSEIKANLQVFKDNLNLIQNNSNLGYQGSSSDTTVATFTADGSAASQSINSSLINFTFFNNFFDPFKTFNSLPCVSIFNKSIFIFFLKISSKDIQLTE